MILDCEHALPNLSTHMHTHTHFHKKHHLKEALFAHKVIFVLLTANTYRMPTLCYRQHSQEPYRLYYRRGQRVKFQSTTGKIYNDVFLSPDFFFFPLSWPFWLSPLIGLPGSTPCSTHKSTRKGFYLVNMFFPKLFNQKLILLIIGLFLPQDHSASGI